MHQDRHYGNPCLSVEGILGGLAFETSDHTDHDRHMFVNESRRQARSHVARTGVRDQQSDANAEGERSRPNCLAHKTS